MNVTVEKHPVENLHRAASETFDSILKELLHTPSGLKVGINFDEDTAEGEIYLKVRFGSKLTNDTVELDILNLEDDHLIRFISDIEQPVEVDKLPAAFGAAVQHIQTLYPDQKEAVKEIFASFYAREILFEELCETGYGLNEFGLEVLEHYNSIQDNS